jgi:hypothetical protein
METSRREFVERLTGGAVLFGAAPMAFSETFHDSPPTLPPVFAEDYDMSWTSKVTGKNKAILDVPEVESAYGVWRAGITKKQLMDAMKVPAKDVSMVLVLRHNGIYMAMNQAFWDAFGIGKAQKVTSPADGKPIDKNPALLDAKSGLPAQFDGLSIPQFIANGGIVLGCDLAFNLDIVPLVKARDKSTDAAARAAALKYLLPNITLQPSGVFAAIRAQQLGCSYVRAS